MGRLFYGARGVRIDMEDRLLAHLQAVTSQKLRRGESFFLSWTEDAADGSGRRAVWIHDKADLSWEWDGSRPIELDPQTLDLLLMAANSSRGLDVHDEAHNPRQTNKASPVS